MERTITHGELGRADFAPRGGFEAKDLKYPPPRDVKLVLGGLDPPHSDVQSVLGGLDPPLAMSNWC